MILHIKRDYDKSFEDNNYKLSADMLNIKSTHLFIASNVWDKITVELDDCIQQDNLKCIPMACKDVKVVLPDTISAHTIQQLTELFPDKAGIIRKTFMQSGDLKGVLKGCLA